MFESALFRPAGPWDPDAVRRHLDALPWAFRDPQGSGRWHLSATARDARRSRAEREAHPDRFPDGVLVAVQPDGVVVDQKGDPYALARGRELVAWLLGQGSWTVRTELGAERPADLGALYPTPLPDPSTLPDWQTRWTWTRGDTSIEVTDQGAIERRTGSDVRRWRLSDETLSVWLQIAADLDLDAADVGCDDPARTASLNRETEGGDDEWAFFDVKDVPFALLVAWAWLQTYSEGGL